MLQRQRLYFSIFSVQSTLKTSVFDVSLFYQDDVFANKALPDRNVIAHVQKDFTGSAVNKPVFLVHQVPLLSKLLLDIMCMYFKKCTTFFGYFLKIQCVIFSQSIYQYIKKLDIDILSVARKDNRLHLLLLRQNMT